MRAWTDGKTPQPRKMSLFITRHTTKKRARHRSHRLSRLLLFVTGTVFLSACSNDYAWVRKDNMDWAQKYVAAQHAEKQDLMAQQEQFAMILERLNTTLARNDQLEQTLARLNQTLARPLRFETANIQIAPAAAPSRTSESDQSGKSAAGDKKMLVGSVETAWFPQLDRKIESRIDTGAQSSSINVADYEVIERDGQKWVRFSMDGEENEENGDAEKSSAKKQSKEDGDKAQDKADKKTFESKLVRRVKILQSSTDEKDNRPVIRLRVVIGNVTQEAEFTLADRDHLSYDALIGRNALRDLMIVDVSKDHVTRLPEELKD